MGNQGQGAQQIKIPERALAELRNMRKRRIDQAAQLRKQASQLSRELSQAEVAGMGWLALALGVPEDWECNTDLGAFVPPRKKG